MFVAKVLASCILRLGLALLWWAGYFGFGVVCSGDWLAVVDGIARPGNTAGIGHRRRSKGDQQAQNQGVPPTHLADMSGTALTHMVVQYEYRTQVRVIWSKLAMHDDNRTTDCRDGRAGARNVPTIREEIGPINKLVRLARLNLTMIHSATHTRKTNNPTPWAYRKYYCSTCT